VSKAADFSKFKGGRSKGTRNSEDTEMPPSLVIAIWLQQIKYI